LNRTVVLSGGSFQNIYLQREIQKRLQHKGFAVFTHKNIPCHDGGLSAGQLIIASRAIAAKEENRKGGQSLVPRSTS
jgi:hydrogenase maturation protein HypF